MSEDENRLALVVKLYSNQWIAFHPLSRLGCLHSLVSPQIIRGISHRYWQINNCIQTLITADPNERPSVHKLILKFDFMVDPAMLYFFRPTIVGVLRCRFIFGYHFYPCRVFGLLNREFKVVVLDTPLTAVQFAVAAGIWAAASAEDFEKVSDSIVFVASMETLNCCCSHWSLQTVGQRKYVLIMMNCNRTLSV